MLPSVQPQQQHHHHHHHAPSPAPRQHHVSTPAQQSSKPRATGTLLKTLHMLQAQQTNSSFDLDISNLLHDQDQEPLNLEQFDDSSTPRSSYQHQTQSQAQFSSPNHGGGYTMEEPNPLDEYLRPVTHSSPAATAKQQQYSSPNNNGGMQTIAPGRWTIGAKGVAMC